MSYKYEGVLKVVRRSRATLIFSVCVPMVKPEGVPENRFPPVRQTIPGLETPSPPMFMGIIMGMCNINMRVF